MKETTGFKDADIPTPIFYILTHHSRYVQRSAIYKTGSSDFHKLAFNFRTEA